MKVWIHRLLNRGNSYVFDKADLTESTASLQNPARGFYRLYSFFAEQEPDFESLKWSIDETATLALVIIDIGAYREKKLDQPAIDNMKAILDFFSDRKLDIILRIAYDHQGNALEREPFFFSIPGKATFLARNAAPAPNPTIAGTINFKLLLSFLAILTSK